MDIRIGTKVRFLNDTGGGIIKGFSDDKIALVETGDGFEIPVLITDLIADTSAYYGMEGEKEVTEEKVPDNDTQEEKLPVVSFEEKKYTPFNGDVLLALVPENDQILHISNFSLYVINNSNYHFTYCASYKDSGVFTHINTGILTPDTKTEVEKYSQTEIAKIREFRLQGLFFKHGLFDPVDPVNLIFNIEKISFYKIQFFRENDYFHQKALILYMKEESDMAEAIEKLKDNELRDVARKKEKSEKKMEMKSPKHSGIEEVDLHIEELVENHSEMSNGEILTIQLSKFEIALESALRVKTRKIVFIHGPVKI
ncbi:hypothetical protein ES708_19803 [subsurface metagenome]